MSLLVALLSVSVAASPSPSQVRELARAVVAAPEYQTALPGEDGEPGGDPDRLRRGAGGAPRDDGFAPDAPPSGALAFIARSLIYILIGAVLAVLIFWLFAELRGREKQVAGEADAPPPAAGDPVVARPLGDAEALARDGRFAEAIHTLLLRTLEELTRRLAAPLPRSLTSREILGRVRLPDDARAALAGLVTATELCWFGDASPGAADYLVCVDRFRSFAAAYTTVAA